MKKFILMMVAVFTTLTMNAQIATENAKLFDNTYVTVGANASVPLAFDAVFPLNASATVAVGKEFTPIWGAEVEGTFWFGSHDFGGATSRFDTADGVHNWVRGSYVGVNGVTNLTNLFCGYKGAPRTFEVKAVLGSGWIHTFTPNAPDTQNNGLGVKTGLDLAFNLGESKANTLSIRPSVVWNVMKSGEMQLEFNKHTAQLMLGVAYTHHFKTSNGTHYFKTYDVGALNTRINDLVAENEALKNRPVEVRTVVKEVKGVATNVESTFKVGFAQNSSELTDEAKAILDKVPTTATVDVIGTTSPEGSVKRNSALSEERANSVADYLKARGVKVASAKGNESARTAIVTIQK